MNFFLSREHFKHLANNIPQMTWTHLPNGEPNYFNQQWYAYTGLNFEETRDGGWQKIIHPDDQKDATDIFSDALKSGHFFESETRYKRASDGTYRWHLNRGLALCVTEKGEIVFWVGTATDIEDQKREMEQKDEFISIASHELKTPLTSVKGYLQLIHSYKKDDVPTIIKQHAAKANIALNKLQHLINDLLDAKQNKSRTA